MEKRIDFKKLIVIFMCGILLVGMFPIGVYAKKTDDYKNFSQADPRWRGVRLGSRTVKDIGCWITSFSVLMAYDEPKLRDVKKFNPGVLAKTPGAVDAGGNFLNSDASFQKHNPAFTTVENKKITGKAAVKFINECLKKDLYVSIHGHPTNSPGGSHMVPILCKDGDGFKYVEVGEVGNNVKGESDFKSIWGNGSNIELVKAFKGKNKSSKMIKGGKGGNESASTEDKRDVKDLINEKDLAGMPKTVDMSEFSSPIELEQGDEGLSTIEKNNLASMRENLEADKTTWVDYVGVFVQFCGLFLCAYGVLMMLALVMDRSSAGFMGFSALSVISFGKLNVSGYDEEGYLTVKDILLRAGGLIFVGLLIMSGFLLRCVSAVILFIWGVLGAWF